MKNKRRGIYVEWKDATTQGGWHYNSICQLMDCLTLGWLMFEDDEKIVVCTTREAAEDGMISSNTIPKAWIKKRKWVKI